MNLKMEDAMQAAFRAGWTAAFTTIADVAEKDGDRESARWFRQMANRPPPVEIGDLATEKGKAMAAQERDVVLSERCICVMGASTSCPIHGHRAAPGNGGGRP